MICNSIFIDKLNPNIPGPGEYERGRLKSEYDLKIALCEAEGIKYPDTKASMSAAFKSESRLKHSAIDSFIKEKSHISGPGTYNVNKSTLKKKTFNYDLAQKYN